MAVHHVAVSVVLDLETAGVRPVVKDLAAQHVAANTPNAMPPLLGEPLVAEQLRVEVGHLEGRVVAERLFHVGLGALHEEAVMVGELLAEIEVEERHDVNVIKVPVVEDVGRHEVEVARIPRELVVEIGKNVPIMPQLVDKRRARMVPLEFS